MLLFICRICSCTFHVTYTSELNDTEFKEPENCRARTGYCPSCGAMARLRVIRIKDLEVTDED